MDRNKPGSSRMGKTKIGAPHHGSEIFALGSKSSSTSSNRDDVKSKVMSSATSANKSNTDRKREAPTPIVSSVAKKPKLPTQGGSGSSSSSSGNAIASLIPSGGNSNQQEYWEQVAQECDAAELVQSVLAAIDRQDSNQVVALLCGAIKAFAHRSKLESVLSLSMLYLAKVRPSLFCNEVVTAALTSVLRRETHPSFKQRTNSAAQVLAANLLGRGYHNKTQWPEKFVRHYIDDAINDRVWCDFDDCASFVENICTAFGTKTPPKAMLQPDMLALAGTATSLALPRDPGDEDSSEGIGSGTSSANVDTTKTSADGQICSVQPRYEHIRSTIDRLVIETIKEQFNRRQAPDSSSRNFLRFLATVCGVSEIRAMVVPRLELWIHNSKLMKPAQELLAYICYNVSNNSAYDHEVLGNLVKVRLKTKALINHYISCIREMINIQPNTLFVVLKNVVQNELTNTRNPNNMGMGMLASIFQAKPDESAQHLATIYQEFLLQREDCLRTLRVFLRELVKILRYEIKLTVFCEALLTISAATANQIESFEFRDRVFYAMTDIVCLCMFLSVSPQIRTGRDTKSNKVLIEYYNQMSRIQREAMKWMFEKVPVLFKPNENDYKQSLQKLLILESPEQYTRGDQWPPEQERAQLLRLVTEIPINQDTILYIALIGMSKEIPINEHITMEIIESVIRRAAALKIPDALHTDKLDIIDLLLTMAAYHHPENIALPADYTPPKLAIGTLYWKAWNILLILSAHNPSTFGGFCWDRYPMLRNLMEMCITNQFANCKIADEELQVGVVEKTQILEFETHLAAATSKVVITEQTSLLLPQLILLDPLGVARRPPQPVLEMFQNQNMTLKLGHLLCRSRKPDLLLDIIQRQGTSQSMPWLADLVQNSEGDFNHLPVQCLCEFLLSNSATMDNHRDIELLQYLQNLVSDNSADHQISCEVLEYFLRRLASPNKRSRENAIKGLQLLLKVFHKESDTIPMDNADETRWLLHYLPVMPHFAAARLIVIAQLRAACQIENNPELVMMYIQFIAANTIQDTVTEMLEHIMDMAQLIVERTTIISYIIPTQESEENRLHTLNCLFVMFNNFLIKLPEFKSPFTCPDYPDLVMVHFSDGNEYPIHLINIHAFIILLTYATMIPNSVPILDYWFPVGAAHPHAFTIGDEQPQPVQIIPDWLKLKMIRSPVDRLVDAAMQDLTPEQIVLFIQSFGTPVPSMSKLLALLDRAVIEQQDAVKSCIGNVQHMVQLIEIHQNRGAKNGHLAMQALQLDGNVQADPVPRQIIVTETLTVVHDTTPVPMNASQTKEIEEILDVVLHKGDVSTVNLARFRRLIQQMLTVDNVHHHAKQQQYTMSKIIQHLHRTAKSQKGRQFFTNMIENDKVISFFRSMFVSVTDRSSNYNTLVAIIDQCIQIMNTAQCPMLFQILFNKRKNYVKNVATQRSVSRKDFVEVLQKAPLMELQTKGNHMLNELIKTKSNAENLIEIIVGALKSPQNRKTTDKIGLLIDWLAELDAELNISNRHNQLDLLFYRQLPQFRYYLLSLLSHQAGWETLHHTVVELLNTFVPNYDATSVLNFIAALIRNPKLWQGQDKGVPKHYTVEYVLSMNESQVRTFIDYIFCECKENEGKTLSARVHLLLQCVHPDDLNLKALVASVRQRTDATAEMKQKFLQQLYLRMPAMKFIVPDDLDDVYLANALSMTGCELDRVANSTMTAISSLTLKSDFQAMSANMELMLRKLAASHPALVLRQVSMLASLLQGRAHMDMHVLRSGHHIPLFMQVFGILELLQPHIFEPSYRGSLQLALECYLTLFHNHGATKDTFHMMFRFMEFLQLYTQTDAHNALKFIEPHVELMEDLAADYRVIMPLQMLVQGVSLLKYKRHKKSTTKTIDDASDEPNNSLASASAVTLTPYTKTLSQNLKKIIAEIQRRSGEDVLAPLQELETVTSKRHVPLEPIHEQLLKLIGSSTLGIRCSAYTLLVRHLKSNPGIGAVNASTLAVYVQCLRDKDSAIVLSALEHLTEIVICLQEHASEILRNVFDLGIKSKMNTFEHIRRCVVALKTQHAC